MKKLEAITIKNCDGGHSTLDPTGERSRHVNRATGTLVSVYNTAEANMVPAGLEHISQWATICHDHRFVLYNRTRKLAEEAARDIGTYCQGCQQDLEGRI